MGWIFRTNLQPAREVVEPFPELVSTTAKDHELSAVKLPGSLIVVVLAKARRETSCQYSY